MATPLGSGENSAVQRMDEATRAAILCEGNERYRKFMSELNRTSDKEIDRALQRQYAVGR